MKRTAYFLISLLALLTACTDKNDFGDGFEPSLERKNYHFKVSPTDVVQQTSTGGTHQLTITTNDTWTATSSSTWMQLSQREGSGDATVTMTIGDNNSIHERRDTTIFRSGHQTEVKVVTIQAARYLTVSPKEDITFPVDGGTSQTFTVDTDGSYDVTSSESWLTISQQGNTFTVTATRNDSGSKRKALITVAMIGMMVGENYEVELPVEQDSVASDGVFALEFDNGDISFSLTKNNTTASFTMKMVYGGTFQMGRAASDGGNDETPVHSVTLSSFRIGETEVTQDLWYAVMGKSPSSGYKWEYRGVGNDYPAYWVSWDDCQEFITELNTICASYLNNNQHFRLPTEAEWEYAARGGNKSKGYRYSGSNDIGSVAWYGGNSGNTTHEVKKKQPNELGLYDMTGNVNEWCYDWWSDYSAGAQTDPVGPREGTHRVYRGGSFYNTECQIIYRRGYSPDTHWDDFGFRLVLGAPLEEPADPYPTTSGLDNGHEWVDLGLSVCWATTNVGASKPGDYGDYYAWGETSTKSTYDWSTYKYCNGSYDSMTKYCTISGYGTVDNKTVLESSDDVAQMKWGGGWRMPSLEELEELKEKCKWEWTQQDEHNGYRVTGPNGNSIFLPAAGCLDSSLSGAGSYGYYWSRTLDESSPYYARGLGFTYIGTSYYNRYYGFGVRPVRFSE